MTHAPGAIRALWRHAAAGGGGRCGGRPHRAAAVGASPRFSDRCSDIACSCCSPWGPDLLRKLAGWVAARSWRPRCWLCLLQPRATPPRSFTRSVGSAAAPGSSDLPPPPPPPALRLRCPPLELSQPCTLWWPQTAPVTSHGVRRAWEQRRVASPGGRRRTCRVLPRAAPPAAAGCICRTYAGEPRHPPHTQDVRPSRPPRAGRPWAWR